MRVAEYDKEWRHFLLCEPYEVPGWLLSISSMYRT